MITTALMVLGWRFLRSTPRAALVATCSHGLVAERLLARRGHRRWKSSLPALLVSFRGALGLGMIAGSYFSLPGSFLAAGIALALLSDIFDGVLARRWGTDTEGLRRWDTRADTFFYACVLVAILLRHPAAFLERWPLITALLAAEAAGYLVAIVKYGRHASYHSILSKIWGLLLAASMIGLLGWGVNNWFLDTALGWGILCNLQGLAMSLLLPTWHRDVLTVFHAWHLRNRLRLAPACQKRYAPSRAWW